MPLANPYAGHVRTGPAYPDCDSDTDDNYRYSVPTVTIDDAGEMRMSTSMVARKYQWSRPGPNAIDDCGASNSSLHPALHALNQRLEKLPASARDCTPQVFDDVLDALRALREAATPPARSHMMTVAYTRMAGIGDTVMGWASADVARARLAESLKACSAEDVADVVAAAFMAALQKPGQDQGGARWEGVRAVLRDIRPDAEAVKRSLDRAEDRGEDGRAPRARVAHAMRSWRSDTARHPAICRMMAEEIGLRA